MRFNIRRTVKAAALALLMALAVASPNAWADDDLAGMGKKLARGLVNAGTGWLEVPKEWVEQSKANPAIGWFVGTFTGSIMTLYRTGAGVYETALFYAPVPPHYDSVIQPNTVFGDVPELR